MKHLNIRVTGKVQGVFFRDSTRKKAIELGIKGFVRNEQEGSVYIEAEGDKESLDKFTEWCRHGPDRAQVDHVAINEDAIESFDSFEIAY